MCRWFAYISPSEPCLLDDVLVQPQHALTKQVHDHYLPRLLPHDHTPTQEDDMKARNMLFNIDGLGIAWYTMSNADFELGNTGKSGDGTQKDGPRPAMFKTISPPLNDLNFRSIAANTETCALFAHIRAASGTPITTVNNHPFVFGRHAFMHNGAVSDFTAIRRALCSHMSDAAYARVLGATDSEHIAALYMTFLTGSGDASAFEAEYSVVQMATALQRAVATVIAHQRSDVGDARKTPNSLNLCATDGVKLVACRFRNHATSQPPSLYYSTRAGTTLNRKYEDHPDGPHLGVSRVGRSAAGHGFHCIVASEPSTYREEDWELIGKNCMITVDADKKVETFNMFYEDGWDATS